MTLPDAGWSDENCVVVFANEVAGGEVEDLFPFHRRVELEVEIVEQLLVTERGSFGAASDLPIATNDQFVRQNQFEEFGVIELRRFGFL